MTSPSPRGFRPLLLGAVVALLCGSAHAEESAHRLTLKDAVARALEKHPALVTASSQEVAVGARIDVAKSEAVPKVGVVGQLNRSTGSVVPGATFGMVGIPGVQGPPGEARFGGGTFQSAVGVTASWDILELVRRPTLVTAAEKDVAVAKDKRATSRLLVIAHTTDAYLVVVEARALRDAAQASEARTKTFHDVVAALVGQKLRPDLDLARADTELSAARVLVEKTHLGVIVTSVRLAESIGESEWTLGVNGGEFPGLPALPGDSSGTHPEVLAYDDAAKAAEARVQVAKLGYLPKVELVGAAWLRGGGYVLAGGPNAGVAGGLLPDTPNWAVGLVVTWMPLESLPTHARAKAESAEAAVQKAKAAEVRETLSSDVKVARASLSTALAVAKETGIAVTAGKKALELANARYTTGVGNVLEVADAERALAIAERDDAVARIEAWRALVAVYRAQGDLSPLLGALGKEG